MGNTFGHLFRITTFGESHGAAMGVVIDGCPPGLSLDLPAVQADLDRRRPGQGPLTSPRQESDAFEILSGVKDGTTLGTPIAIVVGNRDARPGAYDHLADLYRPSHADYTTEAKYGVRDHRGGGRASARETVARVAAGAIARQLLARDFGIEVVGWVDGVGDVSAGAVDPETVSRQAVDGTAVRCPDAAAAAAMTEAIEAARQAKDTVGGTVACVARNVPAGWGEPVFDKLTADLARGLMSLPAARGFEVGEGFSSTAMRGSAHNDPFRMAAGRVRALPNRSGGIQGGITNGETVRVRVAFKPVATVFQPQDTVTRTGEETTFTASGRHDPCVVPRAVPIVEAMVCLVLADHYLRQRALTGAGGPAGGPGTG